MTVIPMNSFNEITLPSRSVNGCKKGRQIITPPRIPDDGSPREALAVYEFIEEIRDAIWNRYDLQLIELMKEERITAFEEDNDDVAF